MRRTTLAALALLVLLVGACKVYKGPTVESLGWVFDNIDPGYWVMVGQVANASAYRIFWVRASDPDGVEDITYVEVASPTGVTIVLKDEGRDHYDADGGYWGGWGHRYYHTDATRSVDLGTYTATARDASAEEGTFTQETLAPGGVGGYEFAYTEEYTGNTENGIPMLKRATAVTAVRQADRFDLTFQVDDVRTYGAWIWLYDGAGRYLGVFSAVESQSNNDAGMYTDGRANTLEIAFGDLDLGTASASDVAFVVVVLTDGSQYGDGGYDFRSLSAPGAVQ